MSKEDLQKSPNTNEIILNSPQKLQTPDTSLSLKTEQTSQSSEEADSQLYIAIEKYLMLIMIEFKDHIKKYQNLYENVKL